jgi:hypothetical protein
MTASPPQIPAPLVRLIAAITDYLSIGALLVFVMMPIYIFFNQVNFILEFRKFMELIGTSICFLSLFVYFSA